MSGRAWLEPAVISVALCWRLDRRDGVSIGFTGHDRDVVSGGFLYRAPPGLMPSAVTLSEGFDADGLDLAGALTSDAISDADLRSGRWDGARVSLFALDWRNPDDAPLAITRGELGDVTVRDDGFTAELRGPAVLLEGPVVERTSPECRAELGDVRCRVDLAGRTFLRRVTAIVEARTIDLDAGEPAANAFGYGRMRCVSGTNSGQVCAILSSAGARIVLREAPPAALAVGDLIKLTEGCDKAFATCRTRFANAENFRGEPHLPGMDLLTRYPGA